MAPPTPSSAQTTSEPSSTHPPDASTSTTSEQENSADEGVAANKVFDTVELLEMILLGVPMMDLFVLQRTSKTFRDTMRGSKKLKQHMFLESKPTETTEWNPVMESLYWQPDDFGNSWTLRGIACFKRSVKFHFEEMDLNEKAFYEPSKYAVCGICWTREVHFRAARPWRPLSIRNDVNESWRNMVPVQTSLKGMIFDTRDADGKFAAHAINTTKKNTVGDLIDWLLDVKGIPIRESRA